jgi:uncharacterized protein YbjT (DUF2867 family)
MRGRSECKGTRSDCGVNTTQAAEHSEPRFAAAGSVHKRTTLPHNKVHPANVIQVAIEPSNLPEQLSSKSTSPNLQTQNMSAIQNVAIIGGNGTLGKPVLEELKKSEFNIYVINRQTSKSVYPRTQVITVPDDLNVDAIAKEFQDKHIDALVIAIAGSQVEQQRKLIDAAFKGGVKRVLPADFGSCDSADEKTNEILPLMKGKEGIRNYLIEMEKKDRDGSRGNLTWTSLINAHFFDWGLGNGLLKFDVRGRKAYLLDGGNIKFSASTLPFIGQAVVKILEKPQETENKLLYVHSLYVTQLEVLAALEKATGDKFKRIDEDSEAELKKVRPKMLEGDHDAREEVVAIWGVVAADWKKREAFANDLLGLKEEDLDEVVQRVVKDM